MSRLSVAVALTLNRIVPPMRMHRELDRAKHSAGDYQAWEYQEVATICRDFEPYWDIKGKHILDIGCGLGGKLAYYVEEGAASVTAIDILEQSARTARILANNKGYTDSIKITAADGANLPFCDAQFDLIISINVLEHVEDPFATLAECRRVLGPGGLILLHFPPFYSPWGCHLEGWINYPWPHLLFSEKTLLKAASQIEAQRRRNVRYIPTAQVEWDRHTHLPNLNRLTARRFQAMIRALGLPTIQCHMLPFGRHLLKGRGPVAATALRILHWLARRPLVGEVITTKMACVLINALDTHRANGR